MTDLSLMQHNGVDIINWGQDLLMNRVHLVHGLIEGSPCLVPNMADGRYSHKGKKVAYCYQIIAYCEFGPGNLKKVAAAKTNNDLTISHLCGTRNCCNGSHLILEPKWLNDLRTHCHHILNTIFLKSGYEGLRKAITDGYCTHNPKCCFCRVDHEDPFDSDDE
jgi:hypothetical protein